MKRFEERKQDLPLALEPNNKKWYLVLLLITFFILSYVSSDKPYFIYNF